MSTEQTKREQIFSELMKEAEGKLHGMLEDFAWKIECKYLPYVESDVDSNVQFRTVDALRAIIAGNKCAMEMCGVLHLGHEGEAMRRAIYEQMKDEIRDAYIADLESRIENLKRMNSY